MTSEELVRTYSPANAAALSPQEIDHMKLLTSDQIKTLAKAYPNTATSTAYLLIIDSSLPPQKQLPSLSTFENLYNIRERNGLKKYVAYGFRGSYKPLITATKLSTRRPKSEVVDLSDTELLSLKGFKPASNISEEDKLIEVKKPKIKTNTNVETH